MMIPPPTRSGVQESASIQQQVESPCTRVAPALRRGGVAGVVSVQCGGGPRSYTGAPITENFDGLGTSGTVITPLVGWDAGQFNPVQINQLGPGNGITTVTDASLVVDDGSVFLANATASIGNLGTTGS